MRDVDNRSRFPHRLSMPDEKRNEPETAALGPIIPFRTACGLACITRTTGHDYIAAGKWQAVKVGARTMVTRESFDAWLRSLPRVISKRGERANRPQVVTS